MIGKPKEVSISVSKIMTRKLGVCILGTQPLVFHRMAEKAKRELLLPTKKTAAHKAQNLKHEPMQEFNDSVYRLQDPKSPTLLCFPGGGLKRAISTAALDVPGATKSQVGRLMWVEEYNVPIYGIPEFYMTSVRMSGPSGAPDIRTRAIVPQWGCKLNIHYVSPQLTEEAIGNLIGSAGVLVGIGDGRQEKGHFNFGQFEVVSETDARFKQVMKAGRKAQESAMEKPAYFDDESRELMEWFEKELARTGAHAKLKYKVA